MAEEHAIELFSSGALADVAAVGHGGGTYVIGVDHTYQRVTGGSPHPMEKTLWRTSIREAAGGDAAAAFRKLPDATVSLANPQSLAMAISKDSLAVIVQANNVTSAWLYVWDIGPKRFPDAVLAGPPTLTIPLQLDVDQGSVVEIPSRDDWSSPFLPPSLWLFHPRLSVAPDTGHLLAAFNTADARAIVFEYARGGNAAAATAKSIAYVPQSLEPAVARSGGNTLLFFRKPTPKWSVHFHDVKLSGTFGPVALPLEVASLEAGAIGPARPVGVVGEVFVYSILQGAGGRITLAAVGGSTQKPELKVLVSENWGGPFQLRKTVALSRVPFRISMVDDGAAGIFFALGMKGDGGGYRVECLPLSLRVA